ncbi:MAG: GDSL-type esterase/lipase family protein [Ilumatobacteraceae bacterium]
MRRRRSLATLAALALIPALTACGSGQAAAPPSPPPTVADVGALPEVLPTSDSATTEPDETSPSTTTRPSTTTVRRTTTTTESPVQGSTATIPRSSLPVGRTADGNRLLMIGDSILASTAERYDGEMCESLVPLGWAVEIDAETGREIEFGIEVLDERLRAGWDAAVVFLGNNYPDPPEHFALRMQQIIDRLQPRPIVLVTVSEYEPQQAEVNYIVRTLAARNDGVRVVDWAERTAGDDSLTRGDDLHPTDEGRRALTSMISSALGRAPGRDDRPSCLPTEFTDDDFT